MKKKRIQLLITSAIVCNLMLAGCGAQQNTDTNTTVQTEVSTVQEEASEQETQEVIDTQTEEAQAAEGEVAADLVQNTEPTVVIGDVSVSLGDDMAVLETELGEPDDYQTAKSCTGEGDDKVYEYAGASIYTYPLSGQDIIYMIEVEGEAKLASNIGIGNSRQDVLSVYGEDNTDDGAFITYEYQDGNVTISFQMNEDNITFIEMYEAR